MITHLKQPEGSSLCGQTCVAMAAGVSLDRACEVFGKKSGTRTSEVVKALLALGVNCSSKLKRVSRQRPVLPQRCIVAIHGPQKHTRWHWMLSWDGVIYDPEHLWPARYKDWRITSYLEIF